jgi:hypothetical protein
MIKCNPNVWDIAVALKDPATTIARWSVNPSYRTELMDYGQRVPFRVTGRAGQDPEPGLWGSGVVIGRVQREEPDDDPGLWVDEDQRLRSKHFVPVEVPLWATPVTRAVLRDDERLAGMEVFRQPQMGNPLAVTVTELAAIEDHIQLPPIQITVGTAGAGFGDPASRAAVEHAAMAAVTRQYRHRRWRVVDVSRDCLGWELECTSPTGRVERVEVKGVSGSAPAILLTRNEARAAREEPGWLLAMVTTALEQPCLHIVDGPTVLRASEPFVYRVDLTQRSSDM